MPAARPLVRGENVAAVVRSLSGSHGNASPLGEPTWSMPMAEPILRRPFPELAHLPGEADLPYEDDEPLAESDYQLQPLDYAYNGLSTWFRDRADVAVQADLFVHYPVVGDNGDHERSMLAADVFVTFGVPKRRRHS